MMKALTKVMIALGVTMSAMSVAQASPELVAADDYVTSEICVVAAEGNKVKLRRTLRDAGLSPEFVAKNVTCNDMPIVEFVEQYGQNVAAINQVIMRGEYSGELISLARH
ncbi:DUF3718 domain-containing protein [Alteromonas gilva]|uniref:DUF3718 domain-containing protein n=1 Tax=Alteromonas gilva TaxID=2987522 RepID=A0ABT5KXA9_9ALTE|nr:DUF3718 domain-containing protein [Alteromonas gilva]MDC8829407.1 DUF3718 domain-containing protein [Alteromonas gilva]